MIEPQNKTAKFTLQTPTLILISFILIAGLTDILTSLIGVYYSPFIEVNAINLIVNFPVGVFVWVLYFIVIVYFCDFFVWKNSVKAVTEKEKETIKFMKGFPYFLAILAFLIPLHNLMLIMGVGLI